MFTGIIQTTGKIVENGQAGSDRILRVRSSSFENAEQPVRIGDSVAVNGVCLTVTELSGESAKFDLATETERKTTLGSLQSGDTVNLEHSLRLGDRLDGHLVQGHVDATAAVIDIVREANTNRVEVELPEAIRGLIVPKGSVTIDGVSLTVGECEGKRFSVYIIPHTWNVTTFSGLAVGSKVNLEADCVARYLRGLASVYFPSGAS